MARTHDGFLNVDLQVAARTRVQLEPLIADLADNMLELFRGRIRGFYQAEYESSRNLHDVNAVLHDLAATIEALNPSARRAWTKAAKRDFNIGVALERGMHEAILTLDPDAVLRVTRLGGRIMFTAYQWATNVRAPK